MGLVHQHEIETAVADPLDIQRLQAAFPQIEIEHHVQIDSTNSRALELARSEQIDRWRLILAEEQTAGRGRGANRWFSAAGAVTFSFLLPAEMTLPQPDWPRLALATGVAVCQTIEAFEPRALVGLKWPNDVFLNGRKVCGILIEGISQPRPHLVVGIGVNVNNSFATAPAELRQIATSIVDETGREHDRTEVLRAVIHNFDRCGRELASDPATLARHWQRYCLLTDCIVRVATNSRQIVGRCQGIDEAGALLLQTEAGVERCVAGTVVSWE